MMEFEKYHKIHIVGHEDNEGIFNNPEDEIVVEEKIDGGNFRFYITDDEKVIFGSRTQELDLEAKHTKNFKRCVDFVREQINKKGSPGLLGGAIYYGECCIKHTMNYDWEKIPPYLGYDIKIINEAGTTYMDYDSKKEMFEIINLSMVPLIKKCKAKDIKGITDKDVPESKYFSPSSEDKQAEGIVFKNYSKQLFAKYVRNKFKEKNAEAFGGSPKYNKVDDTQNAELIFKFCTNARIDKMVFKLMDEGIKLELRMMEHLPKRVQKDIMEEEWKEVVYSNWKIDFRKLRKLITKRCLAVLKQIIVNNSINKTEEKKDGKK